ncbi:MAG TPA: hypothetical protein VMS73_04615 [Anaerolineaceae bacterium]|nr:hypothetical protein [Anaerolineaceae bacterium]
MAIKTWQTLKVQYCNHASSDVSLEAEIIIPSEHLPDLMPRVYAHRCSHAFQCTNPSCVWAGTNPVFDPFKEKQA